MPVHLDTHTPELEIDPSTSKGSILAFLYQNPEFGYRPVEIHEELDIPKGTATGTLSRLYDEELVGKTKDSYYHALEEHEDLRRFAASYAQLTRLSDRHTDAPTIEDATQTASREQQLAKSAITPWEDDIESAIAEMEANGDIDSETR